MKTREYELMRRLAEIRQARGLTQADVADGMGRVQSVVSDLENAVHIAGLGKFWAYLDMIGVGVVLDDANERVVFEVKS